ncbi:ribosomal-processing cysteine protease Prp [Mesoplasma lactucae]|uniref:Ribosomal processing cysteine protease Prp n=1 Tax=Mesoplasma lactucae ATCC 49193 TaxID=81460 RepID=A0A291IR90_9MOLU|nr:ribosomal-processing cysteine protease Prp [Mesoplasma lactucae]ATG97258.1 ribosomal-processing cysteine protease Prp [Mesoplasma lactucae ATCC 49193]ATZ20294.1 hypothetical protein MLACT_v1c04730 [Mesoplasma lactucae ATCC 49193]MCL8216465.1 hypothetical protein [Mesoplasma lactucae ATCC 49193]
MVKIELTKNSGSFQKLKMTGHAESGDFGQDLVCAALTGIISGALNAYDLEFKNQTNLFVGDNEIVIEVLDLTNHDLQETFNFLVIQLKTIAIQYPKNVILKEVK